MRYRADGLQSTYFFRLDGSFVIDATRKGNVARYVNHSCGPNCEPRLVVADGKHHIVLVSKTAINKGEELCYDYKLPLDGTEKPCLYLSLSAARIFSDSLRQVWLVRLPRTFMNEGITLYSTHHAYDGLGQR